jgi:DNA transformation protein
MAVRDPVLNHLLELLAPLGAATARRMFGGWGVYLDGEIVVLFARGVAYAKTDAQTWADFAAAGSAPFVFEGRGRTVETSYWSLPETALDSSEALRPWAQRALAAARRKPAARRARAGRGGRG